MKRRRAKSGFSGLKKMRGGDQGGSHAVDAGLLMKHIAAERAQFEFRIGELAQELRKAVRDKEEAEQELERVRNYTSEHIVEPLQTQDRAGMRAELGTMCAGLPKKVRTLVVHLLEENEMLTRDNRDLSLALMEEQERKTCARTQRREVGAPEEEDDSDDDDDDDGGGTRYTSHPIPHTRAHYPRRTPDHYCRPAPDPSTPFKHDKRPLHRWIERAAVPADRLFTEEGPDGKRHTSKAWGSRVESCDADCVLCRNKLTGDGCDPKLVRLPCSHIFHRSCLMDYVSGTDHRHMQCCLCTAIVPITNGVCTAGLTRTTALDMLGV